MKPRGALAGALLLFGLAGLVTLATQTHRACPAADPDYLAGDLGPFSAGYDEARTAFRRGALRHGGRLESHPLPDHGDLSLDLAWFGPKPADRVLVLSSGTHGVEGFAGSGLQRALLEEGLPARLPDGVGLMMIHAINPYGMAHRRRVNEQNVDLNRNFLDHHVPHPDNPGYDALATALAPRQLGPLSETLAWGRLFGYRLLAGPKATQAAISQGQYRHPTGLFFGGQGPAWSRYTLKALFRRHLSGAGEVVVLDVHTGLGAMGAAELILNRPVDSAAFRRARTIWHAVPVKTTVSGESVSPHLAATLKLALADWLPDARVTAASLEFGTLTPLAVLKALRAENWQHHYGDPAAPRAADLKQCLMRAFYPDDPQWRQAVLNQGRQAVMEALSYLAQPDAS
ncbi:M14 family metallopeptidase [Ferrimonas balearica]|uniref:M14 family metallopeptidase n=1 Tax=Ferrimonas balearica TaxID=44012 RepID=UPI001C991983|nr:M14 family metallopeptidase [Ferrimonas balearica]MBY5993149.1 M14 family metallopeptidase [Ferrimonas balearica]